MRITKRILEIALEGGWKAADVGSFHVYEPNNLQQWVKFDYTKHGNDVTEGMPTSKVICDPYFWEAVGRRLGWKHDERKSVEYMKMHQNGLRTLEYAKPLHDWQVAAHRCFNLILVGATYEQWEEFWEDLSLNQK